MWAGHQRQFLLMWAGDQFQLRFMWAGDQLQLQIMWAGGPFQLVSYSKELLSSFRFFYRTIMITNTENNMERQKWNIFIYDRVRYEHRANSQPLPHIDLLQWSGVTSSFTARRLNVVGSSAAEWKASDGTPTVRPVQFFLFIVPSVTLGRIVKDET